MSRAHVQRQRERRERSTSGAIAHLVLALRQSMEALEAHATLYATHGTTNRDMARRVRETVRQANAEYGAVLDDVVNDITAHGIDAEARALRARRERAAREAAEKGAA